jgi:hypothetical protein
MQLLLAALYAAPPAHAFCGAYVAEEGASLSNRASRIVVARDGRSTTLTMFNDVQGDLSSFALVVPVPAGFDEGNLRLASRHMLEKLDAYSAPRRVAYTCEDFYADSERAAISTVASAKDHQELGGGSSSSSSPSGCGSTGGGSSSLEDTGEAWWADGRDDSDDGPLYTDTATGTEVEEEFDLGEYTAFVVDPVGGEGLAAWLESNGFGASPETAEALQEQIDLGSHFLALRVDMDEAPGEDTWLSPLQLGYGSENVTLPIRLGAASSTGVQDLVVFVVGADSDGTWGISNYPAVSPPSTECMPRLEAGESFADWYEDSFTEAVGISADPLAVEGSEPLGWIREYSWGSGLCDPCTEAGPLTAQDVTLLGYEYDGGYEGFRVTRLRLRYPPASVTQDLALYATGRQENVQMRYVEHRWELESLLPTCEGIVPEEPGACYTAEWWAWQAEQDLQDAATTTYEKGCLEDPEPAGRALLLIPALALLGWRRRR